MSTFLKIFAALLLALSTALPASATTVRVSALGLSGMVPDEEADLDFNPARVASIKGARLFTNTNIVYNRSTFESSSSLLSTEGHDIFLSAELAKGGPGGGWALRYAPDFSRSRAIGYTNPTTHINTKTATSEPVDIRGIFAKTLSPTTVLGAVLTARTSKDTIHPVGAASTNTEEDQYGIGAGALFGTEERNLGAVFFGSLETRDYSAGPTHQETTIENLGLRLLPERRLAPAVLRRSRFEVAYTRLTVDDLNSASADATDTTLAGQYATGWYFDHHAGRVWTVGARLVASQLTNETLGTTAEDKTISAVAVATLGVEQAFARNKLLLRGIVNPVNMNYSRTSGAVVMRSHQVILSANSYTLGLGWRPTPNWDLDLLFTNISLGTIYSDQTAFNNRNTNQSTGALLRFAAAYRFGTAH